MKLSILMPVYNEEQFVHSAIKAVLDCEYPCAIELVVVDDASTDGSAEIIDGVEDERLVKLRHPVNRGKGGAIRTAVAAATGDYCVLFDADLEYRPEDIPKLLQPALAGEAEVVYGNRTFGSHSAFSYWYVQGNRFVTTVVNVLFNSYISDYATCLKLMPTKLYRDLDIKCNGFAMDAEITSKLLARKVRLFEVPIDYRARSREAGKKITYRDGFKAIGVMIRIRFTYKYKA